MKIKLLLLFIVIVAAVLRFYQLGINPPMLNWDEVAWGYNAYSLGIDGRDEFGRFLPHDYLESFGDYKPPVYAYLTVLPVKAFGLNAFATRFPSAFFGTLTIFMTFFLVRRMFWDAKLRDWYGIATAGVLAISPWHIMLSRAAFEANIVTFFLVTAVWLFLRAVQERPWNLPLSAIFFILPFYTFNTGRIVAPLLVVVLVIAFWKKLWKIKTQTIVAGVIGILLLLPTIKFLLSPQSKLRFQEVNIFSDVSVIKQVNQEVTNDNNSTFSKIIHNRRLVYSVDFLQHYFDNFSPAFLFITGDSNPKFSIQDVGQMYLWDLPFFITGIVFLFKKKEGYWWLVPLWILLAVIPAATARETPHALRTEVTLPMFQLFVGYGIVTAFVFLKEKVRRKGVFGALVSIAVLLLLWSVIYFQHSYYTYYTYKYSGDWNYTYRNSIAYVAQVQSQYNKIVVADVLGRPYVYYLFYLHISPQYFRSTANIQRDAFGFVHVNSFGKYMFPSTASLIHGKNYLYIDGTGSVPANAHIHKKFADKDGTVVLEAYTL